MGVPSYKEIHNVGISAVRGFKAAGVYCGIKKGGRDLALLYSNSSAVAAGVFTSNLFQAAPVQLSRSRIDNLIRAVVINSGNANACTGENGMQNAVTMAAATGQTLNINPEQVLVCSTGVIGQQMPMEKVKNGIRQAAAALSDEPFASRAAAEAIMTTDTVIKQVAYRGYLPSGSFNLAGIAKGAGMICPDMATMLAFLVTDAAISRNLLRAAFRQAVDRSFNMITIDGDTSTNDTALILANGAARGVEIKANTPAYGLFYRMLESACRELACQIVQDGEGVTKVITLQVKGAPDWSSARTVARAVLNSPLVKTAFFGEDANWGRIIVAVGHAGVQLDPNRVAVSIGDIPVAERGEAVYFDEQAVAGLLKRREITVTVNLNAGPAEVTAWGSDLSHDYVSINSSYRS